MNTHEQRIREFAYQLWESEGKPSGQTERHWNMACTLADVARAQQQVTQPAHRPSDPVKPAKALKTRTKAAHKVDANVTTVELANTPSTLVEAKKPSRSRKTTRQENELA